MQLQHGPQWTIANGQSLSNAIDLKDLGLVAIQMPAAWTAASITFQASSDDVGTFNDVYDSSGTELVLTGAAASRYIVLAALTFAGMRFIKIRSGTTGTPVNQGAARIVQPMVRKIA